MLQNNRQNKYSINDIINIVQYCFQKENYEEAISYLNDAIESYPINFVLKNYLAVALIHLDRTTEAMQILENICEQEPNIPEVLNNLGNLYVKIEKNQEAVSLFKRVIIIRPSFADAHNNMAEALKKLGANVEAEQALKKCLKYAPRHAFALTNLGVLYTQKGDYAAAAQYFIRALQVAPNCLLASSGLAEVYRVQKKTHAAVSVLNKLFELQPKHADGNLTMGLICLGWQDYDNAIKHFTIALQADPDCLVVLVGLADAYRIQEKMHDAISVLNKLFELQPTHVEGNLIMGLIYLKRQDYNNAIKHFTIADNASLQASPLILTHLSFCCLQNLEWDLADIVIGRIEKIIAEYKHVDEVPPFEACIVLPNPQQQQKVAEGWCAKIDAAKIQPAFKHHWHNDKIKIGYISPNFSRNAIGFLLNKLFAKHNRQKFEIFCFPTKVHDDPYFDVISKSVDHVVILEGMTNLEAAKIIHQNEIDILVDLDGHTDRDNMGILAYQPAKTQCHWLGYTGTTGAKFIQYQIADPYLIPDKLTEFYTENIIRLPYAHVTEFTQYSGNALRRADYGLPDNVFVFCYHGRPYRIDRYTFNAWMQILHAVPDSIIWLGVNSNEQKHNICNYAKKFNIAPERFVFSAPFDLSDQYAHCLSNLWLDTFRYTSGTAGLLCLHGQLPILSLSGQTPQARVSTVYLNAGGLSELIASNADDYIKKAILLATNIGFYKNIKDKMQRCQQSCDVFNPDKFIKYLEIGYEKMHENWGNDAQEKVIDIL